MALTQLPSAAFTRTVAVFNNTSSANSMQDTCAVGTNLNVDDAADDVVGFEADASFFFQRDG